MSWIPLHIHSQYSILDSTCSIKKLVQKAKEFELRSLALTDHGNLFGAIDFYKACKKEKIKPILGCELWMAPLSRHDKKRLPGQPAGYPLVLLAKDMEGFKNLSKLSSIGYLEGFYYYPRIDREVLEKHHKGLICLSGSTSALIPSLIANDKEVEAEIKWYKDLFGEDYYFEFVRHPMSEEDVRADGMENESWLVQGMQEYVSRQEKIIEALKGYGKKFDIKCVAANDTHYLAREDWRAQEILINVSSGEPCLKWERDSAGNPKFKIPNPKRKTYPSHAFDFKSPSSMAKLFQDIPESLVNTLEVAEKCNVEIDFVTKHYPVFIPPDIQGKEVTKEQQEKAAGDYLLKLSREGIVTRYTPERLQKVQEKYPGKEAIQVVNDRLDYEFKLIASKGMCDYLLIVYDFIDWAKKQQIPVGPGRGSAAGSIIAYLIGITDIEPLRFDLFFERFINPERISYPDIDVDICMHRRQEVIDYMIQKYGKDRVAQIITFGTMKAKMAVKDVGRVLSVPLQKVNLIAKLIPDDLNMTLERAMEMEPELKSLYEQDREAKEVLDMALKTEGSIRNTSIHAAGLIVSEEPIMEHIPVCTAKDADMTVTQYAMKPVESVGMLKIDFLGLKTLTSIQKAVASIKENFGVDIDWPNLPLDDKATFSLLNKGKTLGVFQVESGGMQDLARQLHIDHFEEIIAVGALYRPGPMDMIPTFCNRKHGREEIEIDHPLMKDILKETYGVMVYQEQVMQIASLLAGYSLGEGDVLRRAMGKKDREEMARQKDKFVNGALEKGIDEKISTIIFNKIEKFASYGFNKSHATAYAYLTYTTAYLKANYPNEWMAALMTCDRDDLSKVAKFIHEAKSMGIPILSPDINVAKEEFIPTKEGIRFAMSGIKGVGSGVVEAINEERMRSGNFSSLYDFVRRVNKQKVGKKNIELLVLAGCFDFTGWSRDAMRECVDAMYEQASREEKDASLGVMNFFSLLEEEKKPFSEEPEVAVQTSKLDSLKTEKELLGFYLTGHPMDSFREILNELNCVSIREIETVKEPYIPCGFIVETVATKIASKSGRKFAILTISDGFVKHELPIWPEKYEEKASLLEENRLLFAILGIDKKEGNLRLNCSYLEDLSQMSGDNIAEIKEKIKGLKRFKRSSMKQAENQKDMPKPKQLILHLDADQMRHTDVLKLKNNLHKNPGSSPIEILFMSEQKQMSSLFIDAARGVNLESSLSLDLKSLPFVLHMDLKEAEGAP